MIKQLIEEANFDSQFTEEEVNALCSDIGPHIPPGSSDEETVFEIAKQLADKVIDGQRYDRIAARVLNNYLNRSTKATFLEGVTAMYAQMDPHHPLVPRPLINAEVLDIARKHEKVIQAAIDEQTSQTAERFGYMGIKTLMHNYLIRSFEQERMENIEQMYARIAFGICGDEDMAFTLEVYRALSIGIISVASPIMFYAGTPMGSLMSCFLKSNGDSIEEIFDSVKACAVISKKAGGIGQWNHTTRARGTIVGTNSRSDGIIPMLKVFNSTAEYVNQGKNKRPGAFANYLEVWHGDFEEFLLSRKKDGDDERVLDMHIAAWVCDLFMERCERDELWSFMCPYQCPGLDDVYGEEFNKLYTKYESEGRFIRQVKARKVFGWIARAMIEDGEPYFMFKDNINRQSNQKNIGIIKSSNLCVSEDTQILTDQGVRHIGSLVPNERNDVYEERRYKSMQELAEKIRPYAEKGDEKAIHQLKETETWLKDNVPKPKEEAEEVNVWNGRKWSKVLPKKTGEGQNMIHVMTDFGTRIDTTFEHEWIMADGSRKKAKDLKLGDKLAPSPPVVVEKALGEVPLFGKDKSFMMGAAVGYALKSYGRQMAAEPFKEKAWIPAMVFRKEFMTEEVCELLHYDEAVARANPDAPDDLDHGTMAFVVVPEDFQIPRIPVVATIHDRRMWASGFAFGTGGDLMAAVCDHGRMHSIWNLFRSLGEPYRLEAVGRSGLWRLRKIGNGPGEDEPEVIGLMNQQCSVDTYCVTEPLRNEVTFANQRMGNCAEIVEFSSADEIACCTLGAVVVDYWVDKDKGTYNFEGLHHAVEVLTKVLDKVIDVTHYSMPEMEKSNLTHRPIAVGGMAVADTFQQLNMPWERFDAEKGKFVIDNETRAFHAKICETIYHGTMVASHAMAVEKGPYKTFPGSPASLGILHFDMYPEDASAPPRFYKDWDVLKSKIVKDGIRNSHTVAWMPTATTAKIRNKSEMFEPYTSNVFVHSGLAGDFITVSPKLQHDLQKAGLWSDHLRDQIIANNGSLWMGTKPIVPTEIAEVYRTAYEISGKTQLDFASDRQRDTTQTQSFNHHVNPDKATVDVMWHTLRYAHKKGIKTGAYYTRTRPAIDAQKVVIKKNKASPKKPTAVECTDDVCIACST